MSDTWPPDRKREGEPLCVTIIFFVLVMAIAAELALLIYCANHPIP